MTIRIPTIVLAVIAAVVGCAAISFAVAFAVSEWRQSDYLDCVSRVQNRAIDESRAARDDYNASSKSQDASDAYNKRYDDIWREWGDDTKACK